MIPSGIILFAPLNLLPFGSNVLAKPASLSHCSRSVAEPDENDDRPIDRAGCGAFTR